MLTNKLLGIAVIGIDPVLWVLLAMSSVSLFVIAERLLAFRTLEADASAYPEAQLRLKLEKRLGILATFGNNAPFIGLFGTVLGVINAFHTLGADASFGVNAVMGGISEALVATATGLFVAIPSVMAYNYFVRRIKTVLLKRESGA
ncbi:MotA/TolQ/ExbB proton channel family protein [Sulfurimonas diazotrophicus]|uniref:MotA/TolQ/ExbB proton channel family protein n=1 Tax=Sulfurimonas diazotrophicus TaxID=3131939 RepID=A0ABZ3HAC4_9BACT